MDKVHRNDPRPPRTASQQTELHQGTDENDGSIDTDAKDDTESTGHITLLLSSTDYSHLTATKTKMTMNRFCEDEDSEEFELLESIQARAIITTQKKKQLLLAMRSLSDGAGSLTSSTMTWKNQ